MTERDEPELLREAFHKALKLNEASRQAYLERLSRENPKLCREVASLIKAEKESEGFLEPRRRLKREGKEEIRIDRYRLIDKIGEGGAAQVFLARQEQPVKREVALKIMKTVSLPGELAQRFSLECQVLAMMNHPHIAQIYDSGFTESGMGYYAMEFVAGAPITRYCRHNLLNLEERLQLFLKVCSGVSHAHQRLIIHRDLKPANILVHSETGLPKIIDFGIAKHMESGEHTTYQGAFMGTPPYMSPEQVRGDTAEYGTHTDIYALGALLYTLVADAPPFSEKMSANQSLQEVMDLIQTHAPLKPSKMLEMQIDKDASGRVRLNLKEVRELDWLILTAMHKEPGNRYGSVAELVADIQRFLDKEPLSACPPKPGYLFRKFIQRHHKTVWGLMVLLLLVSVGVTMVIQENLRAIRAEARSTRYAGVLEDMLTGADPRLADPEMTVRDFFDHQADQLRGAESDVHHHLLTTLGRTQMGLGNYPKALLLLEEAYSIGQHHPEISRAISLKTGYHLGTARMKSEQYKEAENLLSDVKAGQIQVLGQYHQDTLQTWRALLDVRRQTGQFEGAEAGYRVILLKQSAVLGATHPETLLTMTNMAHLYQDCAQLVKAERLYRQAADGWESVWGGHPYTFNALTSLANNLLSQDKAEEALVYAEQALAGYRQTLSPEHPFTLSGINNLANVLASIGRLDKAETLYREALQLRIKVSGPDHDETLMLMNNLASLLNQQRRYDAAITLKNEEIQRYMAKYGPEDWHISYTQLTLAESYAGSGQYDQALDLLFQADCVFQRTPHLQGEHHLVYGLLGSTLIEVQKYEDAIFYLVKAMEVQSSVWLYERLDECRERQKMDSLK